MANLNTLKFEIRISECSQGERRKFETIKQIRMTKNSNNTYFYHCQVSVLVI